MDWKLELVSIPVTEGDRANVRKTKSLGSSVEASDEVPRVIC